MSFEKAAALKIDYTCAGDERFISVKGSGPVPVYKKKRGGSAGGCGGGLFFCLFFFLLFSCSFFFRRYSRRCHYSRRFW
jgi:hypothetical protein